MSGYFNSLGRGWNSTKKYPISDVSTIFMAGFIAIILIFSGVIIMNDEGIFGKLYPEGFQDLPTGSTGQTGSTGSEVGTPRMAAPPTGLVLNNTTVNSIRKKSSLNLYLSYMMIALGIGIIVFYIGPKLLF